MRFCNFCRFHPNPPYNPCTTCSYAQYGIQSNPPSGSDLPLFPLFEEGAQITLSDTRITLKAGYLYLIDYILLATTETNSYLQITPKIDDVPNLLYSYFAPSGSAARNTSASGSFTVLASDKDTALAFYLTYPSSVRNIDLSGAISVTLLHKLGDKSS